MTRESLRAVLVFTLLFGCLAYFNQGGGVNQFTRWGLTAALVEAGSVRINPYHELTNDKAFKDDNYYCDKAPGLSFAALPGYLLARAVVGPCPEIPTRGRMSLLLYLITLLTVSLPTAVAGTCFSCWARTSIGEFGAIVVTLAVWIGSPLGVYGGLFYGHTLSAALLWLAYLLLRPIAEQAVSLARAALAGFLVGWATLTEMPVAVAAAILGVWLLVRQRGAIPAYVLGGLPCVAILLAYNTVAFGHPLENAYRYEVSPIFRHLMSLGVMGIHLPKWPAFLEITLYPYRGLLFYWPFYTLCVVPAFVLVWFRPKERLEAIIPATLLVAFLALASGYFAWHGGWSYGCRHLIPAMPFAGALVVLAYRPVLSWIAPLATVLSLVIVLSAVATCAEFPEDIRFPLRDLAWPAFVNGELMTKTTPHTGDALGLPAAPDAPPLERDAWNVGQLLRLNGLASLLPLACFVVLVLGAFVVTSGKPAPTASS